MADFGALWAKIWNELLYPIIAFIQETLLGEEDSKIDLGKIEKQ